MAIDAIEQPLEVYAAPPPFFTLNAWSNANKTGGSLLTQPAITTIQSATTHMLTNQAYEYQVTLFLEDAATGPIQRSHYVELTWGGSQPQLLLAGYVLETDRSEEDNGQFTLTIHSALLVFTHFLNVGRFVNPWPVYQNIMDVYNGVGPGPKPRPAGKKGVLDPLPNWSFAWVKAAGDTTIPPGIGDINRADWGNLYQTGVQTIPTLYGFFVREGDHCTATSGVLEGGPLGDDSTVAVFGGDRLAQPNSTVQASPIPQADSFYVESYYGPAYRVGDPITVGAVTGILKNVSGDRLGTSGIGVPAIGAAVQQPYKRVNAAEMQRRGLTEISSVSRKESTTNLKNLIWPVGHGGGQNLVTLRSIFGDVFQTDGKTLMAGITEWRPNGPGTSPLYYVQGNNKQSFRGHTYELCATQGNADWAYGIVDRTSVTTYGGIIEYEHRFPKATNADLLLSLGLGALDMAANPVPEWVIAVRHPYGDQALPKRVKPGQTLHVFYAGAVHDGQTRDSTGKWIGTGSYTYMSFPGTTDPNQLYYLNRVMEIQETIDDTGYVATYTMGKTRKKPSSNRVLEDLASRFEHHAHSNNKKHAWTKEPYHHIPFLFSKNPAAWEDHSQNVAYLNPGGYMMADVPNESFFGKNHRIQIEVDLEDGSGYLDVIFGKPYGGTLMNMNTGGKVYACFRFALTGSGHTCGFWTTSDGINYTFQGHLPNRRIFAPGHPKQYAPGRYRLDVGMSAGTFSAKVQSINEAGKNLGHQHLVATWHEEGQKVNQYGSLGFYYRGGTGTAVLWDFVAHPFKRASQHVTGGGKDGHKVTVHPPGASSHKHKKVNPVLPGYVGKYSSSVMAVLHGGGIHQIKSTLAHGPHHQNYATIGSVSPGSPNIVTFQQNVPENSLQAGYLVGDYQENWMTVLGLQQAADKSISGFTSSDPLPAGWGSGTVVEWDPLDVDDPGGNPAGGKRFQLWTQYLDKRSGHLRFGMAMVDRSMDAPNDGSGDWVTYPDGSHSIGDRPITQPNGANVNAPALLLSGDMLARKLAQQGAYFLDASELDSTTQSVDLYYNGGSHINGYGPNSPLFVGATNLVVSGNIVPASWIAAATAPVPGQSDALLALSVGPYTAPGDIQRTYVTTRWYDQSNIKGQFIIEEDIHLELAVMMGVSQTQTQLNTGAYVQAISYDAATRKLYLSMDGGSMQYLMPGDKFVFDPGMSSTTQVQETFWVESVNMIDLSLVVNTTAPTSFTGATPNWGAHTGLTQPHAYGYGPGSFAVQKTTNYPPNQQLPVYSPFAGTEIDIQHVPPAVDAIAFGLYGTYQDGTGAPQWVRGYWGDPEWKPEYCPSNAMPVWLGPLKAKNNAWTTLQCVASNLGIYGKNLPRFTALGFEVAIHSANPGSGQVVYVDYHTGGAVGAKGKLPANVVTDGSVSAAAITAYATDPSAHPDEVSHLSVHYWCAQDASANWIVHWEGGIISVHDGNANTDWAIQAGNAPELDVANPVGTAVNATGSQAVTYSSSLNVALAVGSQVQVGDGAAAEVVTLTASDVNGFTAVFTKTHTATPYNTYPMVTAVRDYPNVGIPAVPVDSNNTTQLAANDFTKVQDNFLVFNSASSGGVDGKGGIWLLDPGVPGGQSFIPGYSAAGGPYGQATGFGVVTNKFNWKARPGPGTTKAGKPRNVWKIGKLDHNYDTVNGALTIHAPGGPAAQVNGDQQGTGSTGPAHLHPSVAEKFTPHGLHIRVIASNPTTAQIGWDAGQIESTDGKFGPYAIGAGTSSATVAPGSYVAWDYTNPGGGNLSILPPTTDFTKVKNHKWWRLARLSRVKNSKGRYYMIHLHSGAVQVDTDSLTNGSITTAKIEDGAVGTPKMGLQSVDTSILADLSVALAKLQDGAVGTPKLAPQAVTTPILAPAAVTTPVLANGAVAAGNLGPKAVTPPAMSDSSPGKYTWAGMVFQLVAYNQVWNWGGGSMSLSSQVGVSWNYSGSLSVAGGGTEYFPVPTISYTPGFIAQRQGGSRGNGGSFGQMVGYLNQWLIYNYTGSAITCNIGGVSTSIPDDSFAFVDGFTDKDGIYVVGVLTASTDGGWPWLATIHGAAAQMRGIHIGDDTIHNGHLTDNAVLNNNIQPSVLTWNRMLYIATYAAPAVHYSGLTNGSSSIFTEIPPGSIQRTAMSNLVADDQMFWQYATGSGGTINNGPDGSPKPAKLWNEQGHGAGPDNSNTVGVGFTYVCRSSNGSAAVLRGLNIDHADTNGQPDGTVGVDFWYNNASGDAECWVYLTAYAPVHV